MDKELQRQHIDVIVPCRRSSRTTAPLFKSLLQTSVASEFASLNCSVVVVTESPDDNSLRNVRGELTQLQAVVPCTISSHTQEFGLARAVNQALRSAIKRDRDVFVLDPDSSVSAGVLTEVRRVAELDCMIRFVRPRSPQAGICSLPHTDRSQTRSALQSESLFQQLSVYLPPFHFI